MTIGDNDRWCVTVKDRALSIINGDHLQCRPVACCWNWAWLFLNIWIYTKFGILCLWWSNNGDGGLCGWSKPSGFNVRTHLKWALLVIHTMAIASCSHIEREPDLNSWQGTSKTRVHFRSIMCHLPPDVQMPTFSAMGWLQLGTAIWAQQETQMTQWQVSKW